jgi:hypothetical protein
MKCDNVVPLCGRAQINEADNAIQDQDNVVNLTPHEMYELAFTKEVRAKLLEIKRREYGFSR